MVTSHTTLNSQTRSLRVIFSLRRLRIVSLISLPNFKKIVGAVLEMKKCLSKQTADVATKLKKQNDCVLTPHRSSIPNFVGIGIKARIRIIFFPMVLLPRGPDPNELKSNKIIKHF